VADLRQVVFRQAGHFHDGIAVDAVRQHGAGNFEFACLTEYPSRCLSVRVVVHQHLEVRLVN
jgi:hypothetical protein